MESQKDQLFHEYKEAGICCIPIAHRSKAPAISSWKSLQARLPTDDECAVWGGQLELGLVGIALVCGAVSNIIAIDLDSDEHYNLLPRGAVQKVGNRGETRFFLYSGEISEYLTQKDRADDPGIEVKSTGHYTVLPPSVHPAGIAYTWRNNKTLLNTDLCPLESGCLGKIRASWGRTIKETENIASRLGLTVLDAADMLRYIACDSLSHNDWLSVAFGLHYEFGAEAWPIFDSWCRTDPARYNADANHARWLSFSTTKQRKITLNTVAHLATLGGWKESIDISFAPSADKTEKIADRFPVPALPDELLYSAPGLLRRLFDDMCRTAPVPNPHMAFGCALATLASIKSYRLRSESGLRPVLTIAGVSGSGTGKEAPMSYTKKLFANIAEQGKPLSGWLINNLASGQGLITAIKDRRRLILWDELGQYLYQAVKSTNTSAQNILTRITEISTKADSYYLTDAYANADGNQGIEQILNPHISLFGATNYRDIFKAIEAVDFGAGTWARMLFVFGPLFSDQPPNLRACEHDQDLLSELVTWISRNPVNYHDTRVVVLSDEAQRFVRDKWLTIIKRNQGCPEFHREFLNRIVERTIQVVMVAYDGGLDYKYREPVGVDVVAWAYQVVDWLTTCFCERVVPAHFAQSATERVRQAVYRCIKSERSMSRSGILRALRSYSVTEIETAISRLSEEGEIEVVIQRSPKGGGRGKTVYQLVEQTAN